MATYYWVGGNGTWDTSTTTNWATSSGGAGGAGVPTSADSVIFDSNSGAAPTVTISSAVASACTIDAPTSGTLTFSFGTSTLTLSGNFTVNTTSFAVSGTGTITMTASSPSFSGNGLAYYNVTFSSTAGGTTTINGANTFNNLTQTSRNATGLRIVVFGANQTINGTLTFGAANTAIRRIRVNSSVLGTKRTITLDGTLATLADVDFRDIVAAGTAGTWTGTRIGNCSNNSNITFTAAKTVYWNLSGTQNWSATGWATTNNGTPAVNNFPLAQDTAVFTEAGSAGTITFDSSWQVGSIQMADGVSNRTTAFTLSTGTSAPALYGDVKLFSNLTLSGTGAIAFTNNSITQTITSAGITYPFSLQVSNVNGTVKLADNLTNTGTSFTVNNGTLDLNNNTLTCASFSSSNSNTRSISFGTTGQITLTGNNRAVWDMTTGSAVGFSYTGVSNVVSNYSGSTGTRSFVLTGALSESQALNFNITAGTDIVAGLNVVKNIDFSGFSGTLSNGNKTWYGNAILSSGMTVAAGTSALTFAATSGTQKITTNGKTLDFPLRFNGIGGTFEFQDALTQSSTGSFTITNGTVKLKAGATTTVGSFVTSGTNQKYLQSTVAGSQATLSQASGTINTSYLTIKDINATGGATWNAYRSLNNIDAGNNTGWDFLSTPVTTTTLAMRLGFGL